MADKKPDPTEAFRNLVTEWERGFDSMANRIMGTDEFSRGMNQLQDLQLTMQKRFNEAMGQQLSNFNIPSRDDILRLGESVRSLESRLTRIENMLGTEASAPAPTTTNRPPRTRRPPSERARTGQATPDPQAASKQGSNDG
jgi:hypothetical protein